MTKSIFFLVLIVTLSTIFCISSCSKDETGTLPEHGKFQEHLMENRVKDSEIKSHAISSLPSVNINVGFDSTIAMQIASNNTFHLLVQKLIFDNYIIKNAETSEESFEIWRNVNDNPANIASLLSPQQLNEFNLYLADLKNIVVSLRAAFPVLELENSDIVARYYIAAFAYYQNSASSQIGSNSFMGACCDKCVEAWRLCNIEASSKGWSIWAIDSSIGLMSWNIWGVAGGFTVGTIHGTWTYLMERKYCEDWFRLCKKDCNEPCQGGGH
jgi:hypothetical protein